jgi:hypothetical protein
MNNAFSFVTFFCDFLLGSVARREHYKKMWWELKRLAKRTRKDKTQGQEELAQAIRAARADFKTSEQRKI